MLRLEVTTLQQLRAKRAQVTAVHQGNIGLGKLGGRIGAPCETLYRNRLSEWHRTCQARSGDVAARGKRRHPRGKLLPRGFNVKRVGRRNFAQCADVGGGATEA